MTNPIFFAPADELKSLSVGDSYQLAGAEGRHATTVKRIAAGEPVDVCDGGGLRLSGTVTSASVGVLELVIDAVTAEPSPAHELVLIQALAKGDRDELAIETATELGVDGVVPWQSERSIVRWKADKAAKGVAKWRNVVGSAAKQARRSRIPWVGDVVSTAGVAELVRGADLALILHEDAPAPLRRVVLDWQDSVRETAQESSSEPFADRAPATQKIVLIVGPEGGISANEVELFSAAGARLALLGHHVLRSSTAGPAAVVLLSDVLGRWDS